MFKNKYVVIPGATDLNRGDQALIWESVRLAKEAGLKGKYYLLESGLDEEEVNRQSWQSKKEGFEFISPVLLHPGRNKKEKSKSHLYSKKQIITWGIQSLIDFIKSSLLLNRNEFINKIGKKLINDESRKSFEIFSSADAVILKGGGLIHSYGGITATYQMYYSLYHILLAKALNKPVIIMPNSFGPFKGFLVSKMVKNVLLDCEVVTARESISSYAISGLLKRQIPVFPDLGFFLETSNNNNLKEYLLKKGVPLKNKRCIGITARPYRFPKSDNPKIKYRNYINEMAKFSEWLDSQGYHLVFMAHTLGPSNHEDDRIALKDIIDKTKTNNITYIEDEQLDCRDLKSIYGELDFVIGTRFHSVIFSLAASTPALAISYGGHKGDGIMKDMKLSNQVIPIEEVDFKKLKISFDELESKEKLVKNKINEYIDKAKVDREKLKKMIEKNVSINVNN